MTTFSYGVRNELNLVLVDSPNETVAPIMVKQLADAPPKKIIDEQSQSQKASYHRRYRSKGECFQEHRIASH